jgi:hypothetical protein
MKKTVLVIIMLFFCAGMISAQPSPPSMEKHFKHLKRVLQLNDSQAEKVKSILSAFHIKMKELHQKIEANRMKDMEEMDKIRSAQEDQISKVLNADQKKKFDELNDEPMMPPPPEMLNAPGHGKDRMHVPGKCNEPGKTEMHNPEQEPVPHD